MFEDGRSRRVVFRAHCFFNQNSISDGTVLFPAAFKELVQIFLTRMSVLFRCHVPNCAVWALTGGILTAPAVPLWKRIRGSAERWIGLMQKKMGRLVEQVMDQVREYHKYGFEIVGIVGANRSPNCGVETTSDRNEEVEGKGLFMEELCKRLSSEGLDIPMIGMKGSDDVKKKIGPLLF